MTVVALDAMGGDGAPGPELAGALAAVRDRGVEVVAVGDEPRMRAELARLGEIPAGLRLVHASEVVTMEDHPVEAFRKKRDSSLRVAIDLVRAGQAAAVVSAGNSGAVLATAQLVLGRMPGVTRPAIAAVLPTRHDHAILCDAGANVDVTAAMLAQFAVLGACYDRVGFGRTPPRVGLLANGAEAHKGTELTRAAAALIAGVAARAGFEFVGYVEGTELFDAGRGGRVDVIATDGFTGNVVLKACEAIGLGLLETLAGELGELGEPAPARSLAHRFDYAHTGGALLAGVDGLVVVAHGRSSATAIEVALDTTRGLADRGLIAALRRDLAAIAADAAGA